MLDELDNLASKVLDGSLEEPERQRLNVLLKSEENRIRYIELNKVHYSLSQRALPEDVIRTSVATSAVHDSILAISGRQIANLMPAERRNGSRYDPDLHAKNGGNDRGRLVVFSVAAALLLVSIGLYWLRSSNPTELQRVEQAGGEKHSENSLLPPSVATGDDPGEFAARIVSVSDNAIWKGNKAPGDFLMRLPAGEELELLEGIVKLEFASKALAVLRAPVQVKILGRGDLLLRHGRLTGRSEQGDFRVQTPSAYVVDVGTAFGVAVDEDAVTNVVVFDGEVHVKQSSASEHKVRLTSGMSVRVDKSGLDTSHSDHELPVFDRNFNGQRPNNLGADEISLVDIICGSAPEEYRFAGSIDPERGTWSTLPWSESKGVRGKSGTGKVVAVEWNSWVEGVFIPSSTGPRITIDLAGSTVDTPPLSGGAWGPIWARRRMERHLDPLSAKADKDVEGFWGAGTTTALLDRSRWVRDGIVGMHANVGITINLAAIRSGYGVSLSSVRGVLALLEQSYVSQPFQPQALARFQIYVDGELRYERADFCRQDGDAMFGAELHDSDQLLTLIVTDGNDGPVYDRVILLDPILETHHN